MFSCNGPPSTPYLVVPHLLRFCWTSSGRDISSRKTLTNVLLRFDSSSLCFFISFPFFFFFPLQFFLAFFLACGAGATLLSAHTGRSASWTHLESQQGIENHVNSKLRVKQRPPPVILSSKTLPFDACNTCCHRLPPLLHDSSTATTRRD